MESFDYGKLPEATLNAELERIDNEMVRLQEKEQAIIKALAYRALHED